MTKESQALRILKHMLKGNRISQKTALALFGTFNLRNRIHDLRKKKIDVCGVMIYEDHCKYMQYWIDPRTAKMFREQKSETFKTL